MMLKCEKAFEIEFHKHLKVMGSLSQHARTTGIHSREAWGLNFGGSWLITLRKEIKGVFKNSTRSRAKYDFVILHTPEQIHDQCRSHEKWRASSSCTACWRPVRNGRKAKKHIFPPLRAYFVAIKEPRFRIFVNWLGHIYSNTLVLGIVDANNVGIIRTLWAGLW